MLESKISLLSLALPWDPSMDVKKMKVVSEKGLLFDLPDLDEGKDLALQGDDGVFSGWIPFKKIVQVIFQQWKICRTYYETLICAVDHAITAVDREGNIVSWNHKSEEIFQCSHDEIMGKPITDFFEQDSLEVVSVLKNGKGVIRKYHQPYPGVSVLINALPVVLNKKVIGGISVEQDITDVVRLNDELSTTFAYIRDLEDRIDKKQSDDPFHKIKGRSKSIRKAVEMAKKVATTDASVLITGESGVGKELFANAIHKSSSRSNGPFVDINCGAIPAPLFESELFGYEKGAFTGANKEGKKGKFDMAKGGTLFLDEIGEMPLDLQVKLLRVLQEKQYYRIGGNEPIPLDVRIISATNRNLDEMIQEGLFRQDLYYRLNIVSIEVPPLRERKEDIPELVQLCLNEFAIKYSKPVPGIDSEVMYRFVHYHWHGNIRELRNIMEQIVILADEGVIQPRHLPASFVKNEGRNSSDDRLNHVPVVDSEESRIREALMTTYGNKSAAAKLLNISRSTLYNKIRKYNL